MQEKPGKLHLSPFRNDGYATRPRAFNMGIAQPPPDDDLSHYLVLGFYATAGAPHPDVTVSLTPDEAIELSEKLLAYAEDLKAGLTWL